MKWENEAFNQTPPFARKLCPVLVVFNRAINGTHLLYIWEWPEAHSPPHARAPPHWGCIDPSSAPHYTAEERSATIDHTLHGQLASGVFWKQDENKTFKICPIFPVHCNGVCLCVTESQFRLLHACSVCFTKNNINKMHHCHYNGAGLLWGVCLCEAEATSNWSDFNLSFHWSEMCYLSDFQNICLPPFKDFCLAMM